MLILSNQVLSRSFVAELFLRRKEFARRFYRDCEEQVAAISGARGILKFYRR